MLLGYLGELRNPQVSESRGEGVSLTWACQEPQCLSPIGMAMPSPGETQKAGKVFLGPLSGSTDGCIGNGHHSFPLPGVGCLETAPLSTEVS